MAQRINPHWAVAGMVTVAAMAFLVVFLIAGFSPTPREAEIDRYTTACHDRGGFVSVQQGWTATFSCVGQTSGSPLPPMKR
jgi:hypothetical protein